MRALWWFLVLSGCAGANYAENGTKNPDDSDGTTVAPVGTLRIDVTPSADELGLLPQSFIVEESDYVGRSLVLEETVTVFGTLSALTYTTWGVSPPSTEVPLLATVSVSRADALQAGAGASALNARESEASFSFGVPADPAYFVTLVPEDPTTAPFLAWSAQRITEDRDLTQIVEPGAPVYGRVVDAAGAPVADVSLQIGRADLNVSSHTFTTDADGWFLARVEPGYDYVLSSLSEVQRGVAHPEVALPFTVADEEGVSLTLDLGVLDTTELTGTIVDFDGEPVSDGLLVRATSTRLDGSDGAYTYALSIGSNGKFSLDLLPGEYVVEVIPPYGTGLTPRSINTTIGTSTEDLGAVRLDPAASFSGTVLAEGGAALAGASVTLQQAGFEAYTWNTTTDADGFWSLSELPSTALTAVVTPSSTGSGAIARFQVLPGETVTRRLIVGEEVSGTLVANGAAVPFALVEVRDARTLDVVGRTISDADGAYAIRIDPALLDPSSEVTGTDTGGTQDTGDTGDTGDSDDTSDTGQTGGDTGT